MTSRARGGAEVMAGEGGMMTRPAGDRTAAQAAVPPELVEAVRVRLSRAGAPPTAAQVAAALRELIDHAGVADACHEVASRFAENPRPMERAAEAIESLHAAAPVAA